MILRVNNTERFNLSMTLNINDILGYIEVLVTFRNKEKGTVTTKTFPAADYAKALAYYRQTENMFF